MDLRGTSDYNHTARSRGGKISAHNARKAKERKEKAQEELANAICHICEDSKSRLVLHTYPDGQKAYTCFSCSDRLFYQGITN